MTQVLHRKPVGSVRKSEGDTDKAIEIGRERWSNVCSNSPHQTSTGVKLLLLIFFKPNHTILLPKRSVIFMFYMHGILPCSSVNKNKCSRGEF